MSFVLVDRATKKGRSFVEFNSNLTVQSKMAKLDLTGYHLSFDAEMSSPADMSQFANTFINGDRTLYTNYEDEEYVDNNSANPANPFSFADGALTITAQPIAAGGHSYTSGTIQTFNSFSQNQGYFEESSNQR